MTKDSTARTYQPPSTAKPGVPQATSIEGLYFIPADERLDERGSFTQLGQVPAIESITGEPFVIKQFNLARSNKNVIRGFHAEQWNKLVTVASGSVYCVLVDIRQDSPTFMAQEHLLLGNQPDALTGMLYISAGVANSVCVTEAPVNYLYAVDALYEDRDPQFDVALNLFDTTLAIQWPIDRDQMVISERDLQAQSLESFLAHRT